MVCHCTEIQSVTRMRTSQLWYPRLQHVPAPALCRQRKPDRQARTNGQDEHNLFKNACRCRLAWGARTLAPDLGTLHFRADAGGWGAPGLHGTHTYTHQTTVQWAGRCDSRLVPTSPRPEALLTAEKRKKTRKSRAWFQMHEQHEILVSSRGTIRAVVAKGAWWCGDILATASKADSKMKRFRNTPG